MRSPAGVSPNDPRPEPQAHPQLLTLPQPGTVRPGAAAAPARHATPSGPPLASPPPPQLASSGAPALASPAQGASVGRPPSPALTPTLQELQRPELLLTRDQAVLSMPGWAAPGQPAGSPLPAALAPPPLSGGQHLPPLALQQAFSGQWQLTPTQLQQLQQLPHLANLPATLPPPGSAEAARLLGQVPFCATRVGYAH